MDRNRKSSAIIRFATSGDVVAISDTYTRLLKYEQEHGSNSNWQLGVYPTIETAKSRTAEGTMYVIEDNGQICGSMVLNQEQAPEYEEVAWKYQATAEQVLVIHTLCIPPDKAGKGYATQMLDFAKAFAKRHGCKVIRIDTYAENNPAKKLYLNHGFEIAGYGNIVLQGLIPEPQMYLECLLSL